MNWIKSLLYILKILGYSRIIVIFLLRYLIIYIICNKFSDLLVWRERLVLDELFPAKRTLWYFLNTLIAKQMVAFS